MLRSELGLDLKLRYVASLADWYAARESLAALGLLI